MLPALDHKSAVEAASRLPPAAHTSLRVLVIDGHPRSESFCAAIANVLRRSTATRAEECRLVCLRDLEFDLRTSDGSLEPDLRLAQADLLWAEIVVLVYPTWWGTTPALLKAFLDRVLRPGFAFAERSDGGWRGLLVGRAALLVTTMDTPRWIYRWLLGAPGHRAIKDATLRFCGIDPVRIISFGPVRTSTNAQRRRWLAQVAHEGRHLVTTFRSGWRVKLRAWIVAARLHFYVQPWLAFSTGALAAAAHAGTDLQWAGYALGGAAIFLLEFITVITNELADFESDLRNANSSALTGGSRVLVDGRLSARELRCGRALALCSFATVVFAGGMLISNPGQMAVLVALGLALGLGYSAPPIRLCARGLGELDVAFTHSFLVILAGYLSQGSLLATAIPWLLGLPLFFAVLPSIILAGLPDLEADKATGKRTIAVRFGRHRAACFAAVFALVAAVVPLAILGAVRQWVWLIALPAIPHAAWLCARLRRYVKAGAPAGRIDTLLIIALSLMLWFSLIPLGAILSRR